MDGIVPAIDAQPTRGMLFRGGLDVVEKCRKLKGIAECTAAI